MAVVLCLVVGAPFGSAAQTRKEIQPMASIPRKARLKCSPQKLLRGDILTLDMATPHGGDLAVRAPDGTDFLIVYVENDEGPGAGSLMNPKEFINLSQLKLFTDKSKARPWVYGRDKNELIFTRPGWYQVRLSENLQTDDGTPVYQCRVYYSNKPRT